MKRSLILSLLLLCGCQSEPTETEPVDPVVEDAKIQLADGELNALRQIIQYYEAKQGRTIQSIKDLYQRPKGAEDWRRTTVTVNRDPWGNAYFIDGRTVKSGGPTDSPDDDLVWELLDPASPLMINPESLQSFQ